MGLARAAILTATLAVCSLARGQATDDNLLWRTLNEITGRSTTVIVMLTDCDTESDRSEAANTDASEPECQGTRVPSDKPSGVQAFLAAGFDEVMAERLYAHAESMFDANNRAIGAERDRICERRDELVNYETMYRAMQERQISLDKHREAALAEFRSLVTTDADRRSLRRLPEAALPSMTLQLERNAAADGEPGLSLADAMWGSRIDPERPDSIEFRKVSEHLDTSCPPEIPGFEMPELPVFTRPELSGQ